MFRLISASVIFILIFFVMLAADVSKPRYVRVNTLKMDVESAFLELSKQFVVNTLTYISYTKMIVLCFK